MFDIAMAGPLLGMLASLAALVVGSQLSVADDATYFPALPMEFFRQSTLGGTIIDTIVKGSLYLPPGAPANELLVYLHPVAVAGFAGLFVNALAFLPIGSKYEQSSFLFCSLCPIFFYFNVKPRILFLSMTSLSLGLHRDTVEAYWCYYFYYFGSDFFPFPKMISLKLTTYIFLLVVCWFLSSLHCQNTKCNHSKKWQNEQTC